VRIIGIKTFHCQIIIKGPDRENIPASLKKTPLHAVPGLPAGDCEKG
jgi:hypothetical protein